MDTARTSVEWAAGFFDGEGSTSLTTHQQYIVLSIMQKDRECLDRFQTAVGLGTIYGPNCRGYYQYSAYRREAQQVLSLLWPYLGTLKRQQAHYCLTVDTNAHLSVKDGSGQKRTRTR